MLVIAVPAIGAMALAKMLYFLPSMASVRVRPMIPALAVQYWKAVSFAMRYHILGFTDVGLSEVTVCRRSLSTNASSRRIIRANAQIPTWEAVVTIRPNFCFWNTGHTALAH